MAASSTVAAQADSSPDRWQVSASLSFTDQSGNRALRLLTTGLSATHLQREHFRLDGSLQSRYGRSDGEVVALNHFAALAFDLRPVDVWSPFVFTDAERDHFKQLDLRLSTGMGAKYTAYRAAEGPGEASVSLALLHSYESLAPPDPRTLHRARWSLRLRGGQELGEGITFRHTMFYQPIWDRMADYLLRSDTRVRVVLTERLSLSIDYQWKRDARPPPGVERDDRLFTTGLIMDF